MLWNALWFKRNAPSQISATSPTDRGLVDPVSFHDHSFVRPCAPVRNGQRHGVLAAARRVDEGAIADARSRQQLAIGTDATLDHLERDEALDIGSELGEIFSRRAGAVLLQRTIDDALRQGWIERPARTVSYEDELIATCAVVALEHFP